MIAARLRGIEKVFRRGRAEVRALRGVDLDVEQGELIALMGPSGSGKTSLLNILGCLDLPSAGTYLLGDRVISARAAGDLSAVRSRAIGFVFQGFNLIPVLSAWDNVALGLAMLDLPAAEARRRVGASLEAVGLLALAKHRPDELSGGQQQRVAIARALAPRPRLILADEPTASLDTENARAVIDLLVDRNRRDGVTVIFSTHDPRILADTRRVVRLMDGRIAEPGAEVCAAG